MLFVIGVDEMSWDDLYDENYYWFVVSDVVEYWNKVCVLVCDLIDKLEFMMFIDWESFMWFIVMGIEYECIYLEILLVLIC